MTEPTGAAETQGGDDLLAALADEFLRRHRAGEQPSVDEYAVKHPGLAERIRELFPAMLVMEQPGLGATLAGVPPSERIGATIGRYRLLERASARAGSASSTWRSSSTPCGVRSR